MNALPSDFTRADKKRKIMLKAEASTKKSLTMGVSGVCTIINLLRTRNNALKLLLTVQKFSLARTFLIIGNMGVGKCTKTTCKRYRLLNLQAVCH